MHPLSVVSLAIFVAGYITARWDLVTRLYELAIFAWDHGVVVSAVAFLTAREASNVALTDPNCQRICYSVGFFLPVHHTGGKAGFKRDATGRKRLPGAMDTANVFTAPEV